MFKPELTTVRAAKIMCANNGDWCKGFVGVDFNRTGNLGQPTLVNPNLDRSRALPGNDRLVYARYHISSSVVDGLRTRT